MEAFRTTLVPTATELQGLAEESYRLGRNSILAALDAQRSLRDVRYEYLQAALELQAAVADLEDDHWWTDPVAGSFGRRSPGARAPSPCSRPVRCSRSSGDEEIASVDVPTITGEVGRAVRGDLVEPLVVRGSVVALPNQDVRVAALVAGRVDSLPVAEGDWVRSGQVVAEIDPRPFADLRRQAAATLAQARALTENARLNLDRTEQLFQRGIASGKEVEDARTGRQAAESGVEQAAAALDTADRQLSRTKVTSPISGQVVKRLVAVGEQVDGTAGEPLVEIANVDQVEVAANIPADHIGKVKVGQGAIVLVGCLRRA